MKYTNSHTEFTDEEGENPEKDKPAQSVPNLLNPKVRKLMGTGEQNVSKQKGGISGTPDYLAPEILKKQEIGKY